MRITIVSDVFPPEPLTSAATAADLAGELTARGHDLRVVAPFPNRPSGHLVAGTRRVWRRTECRDGYEIAYRWHTLSRTASFLSRAAENVSFGVTSTLELLRGEAPDVVYMNTWPLFAQGMNMAALSARGVPTVCVVHDLYPETLAQEGRSGVPAPVAGAMRAIDRGVLQKAAVVTALNETQADYLADERGVWLDRLRVFHDWVDAERFPAGAPREGVFRKAHGLIPASPGDPSPFVAMYVGSLTRMAGLEIYLEAAHHLRHRADIRILLVGDGAMREEIEAQIEAQSLHNLRLIPTLTPDRVPETQAAADVLMMSLRPGAALHTTPSKLVFYLFSERPILGSVSDDSPAARLIRDAECGAVVRQGDGKELALRIEGMAEARNSLPAMGARARAYAVEHFERESVLPKICDMIEEVGAGRGRSR